MTTVKKGEKKETQNSDVDGSVYDKIYSTCEYFHKSMMDQVEGMLTILMKKRKGNRVDPTKTLAKTQFSRAPKLLDMTDEKYSQNPAQAISISSDNDNLEVAVSPGTETLKELFGRSVNIAVAKNASLLVERLKSRPLRLYGNHQEPISPAPYSLRQQSAAESWSPTGPENELFVEPPQAADNREDNENVVMKTSRSNLSSARNRKSKDKLKNKINRDALKLDSKGRDKQAVAKYFKEGRETCTPDDINEGDDEAEDSEDSDEDKDDRETRHSSPIDKRNNLSLDISIGIKIGTNENQ